MDKKEQNGHEKKIDAKHKYEKKVDAEEFQAEGVDLNDGFKLSQESASKLTEKLLMDLMQLQEDLSNCKAELNELKTELISQRAEFSNYKKRNEDAAKNAREDGRREVFEKLMTVVDSFAEAKKYIKDQSTQKGLDLILIRFDDVFKSFGISKIEALGKILDPQLHHAVGIRDDPKNNGIIVEVFQDGYIMNGKVLRHATVIVGQ